MEISMGTQIIFTAMVLMFVTAQAVISFHLLCANAPELSYVRGERHDLQDIVSKEVHFSSNGKDFTFPIRDISSTGMAFYSDKTPSSLSLENYLEVDIGTDGEEELLRAKVIYFNIEGGQLRVGLKFDRELKESSLLSVINEHRILKPQLSLAA